MAVEYLVRGATLKCEFGEKTSLLELPTDHGIYATSRAPIIISTDCKADINIKPFGKCNKKKGKKDELCVPDISSEEWLNVQSDVEIAQYDKNAEIKSIYYGIPKWDS